MKNNASLLEKIRCYYLKYYKEDCCLPDYHTRIDSRIHEEEKEARAIERLLEKFNLDFSNQKHFIFGAGTGGLALVLRRKYGCEVFGIEPNREAIEIVHEKCRQAGIDPSNFKCEFGERISFAENSFDFVHCVSVIEHVADVEKCIEEMIRITKPGGRVFVSTPNYQFPYERHYKIIYPTFLPKWLGAMYLRIRGKNPSFLKTINFITDADLQKILFKQNGISWLRLYISNPQSTGSSRWLWNYLFFRKGIYMLQEILIRKEERA